ncbi:MAG TPA: type II secretion system protein N [Usitatibacter sp.]|nr:type II secretion system protein N [Usitatibacter sp.]
MAAIADRDEKKHGVVGTLAIVALTLVLAFQLAHWTWVFIAPPEVARTPEADAGVDMAAIAKLFGAAPPASSSAASTSGLRLKGVVAPDGGPIASAIFSTGGGKDLAVFVDREVSPGMKLVEVKPDHVIVSRNGARERIDLDVGRSTASSGNMRGGRPVPGFRVNVARSSATGYSFSRKELDDALRDPGQLSYLGVIGMRAGGGVIMEATPPGSLANKLGLQAGDTIKKINGQPVNGSGDLARFYQQFATTSVINAEIQRGSAVVQLSYTIQP